MDQPALAMESRPTSLASSSAARRVSNVKHSNQSHIRVSPPRSGPGCRIRMPSAGRFPLVRSLDSRIARGPRGLYIGETRVVPAPSAAASRCSGSMSRRARSPPGTSPMRASPRCGKSILRARGRRRLRPCWPRRCASSMRPSSFSGGRRTSPPLPARPRERRNPRFSPS